MEGDDLNCEIYNKNLNNMMIMKNEASTDAEKLETLLEFAKMFTMLPEQRLELLKLSRQCKYNLPKDINNYLYSTTYGDPYPIHILWLDHHNIITKLNEGIDPKRFQLAEEALTFPHKLLDEISESHYFHSVTPLHKTIKKQYVASTKIYNKIVKCKNDIDKWLECIKEIEKKEAVIANLELSLGQDSNWRNKKVWKFYFDFLKEKKMKEILEVFRKYTRLFTSDKQAVEDYRKEIVKFSSMNVPTSKYWIDTIKYEMIFGTLELAYCLFEKAITYVIRKPYHLVVKDFNDLCSKLKTFEKEMIQHEKIQESLKITKHHIAVSTKPAIYYYQNPQQQQYFCFHQSFINNLLKNAKGKILRKLYASCKFFFSLKKAPLCYRLEVSGRNKTSYCQESLFVNEKDQSFSGLNNLHVYHMLVVFYNSDRNIISHMLPKLRCCCVRHIFIKQQDITVPEFKFMLSKNIFQIMLIDVNIHEANGNVIDANAFFKILQNYPSIKALEFFNRKFLIVESSSKRDRVIRMITYLKNHQFETIYIVNQNISAWYLHRFIDYQHTKCVTLKQVYMKNAEGNIMGKQQLKDFVAAKVNPKNNVSVNIF